MKKKTVDEKLSEALEIDKTPEENKQIQKSEPKSIQV